MNEKSTNNSMLFMVGGLQLAALAVGYFAMDWSEDVHTDTVVIDTVEDVGTNFRPDAGKNGNASGTIAKKSDYQANNRGPE